MSKCWLYHKTEAPKVVDSSEVEQMLEEGWADTPAAFFDASEHIDLEDDTMVQALGGAIQDITDQANDLLKAETAKTKGLMELAEKYGVEVTDEMETPELRAAVIANIGGEDDNSTGDSV